MRLRGRLPKWPKWTSENPEHPPYKAPYQNPQFLTSHSAARMPTATQVSEDVRPQASSAASWRVARRRLAGALRDGDWFGGLARWFQRGNNGPGE